MPNNQVNVTELNLASKTAPLRLLMLMRDLEVFGEELWIAEERVGQPVWTYQDPLTERLRRVGVSDQMVEDFSAWRRTISGLITDHSRDENQLAKIDTGRRSANSPGHGARPGHVPGCGVARRSAGAIVGGVAGHRGTDCPHRMQPLPLHNIRATTF